MKTLKYIIVLVFTISVCSINAQEKKIKFNKGTLKICSSKSFVIEGYDGDEVIIESLHEKRQSNKSSWVVSGYGNLKTKNNKEIKKGKRGDWVVTSTAVSGVYSENDNDTLIRPKSVFFNSSEKNSKKGLNNLGKKDKNKKSNWVISSGINNVSYFNTEIDSLSSREAIFMNYFKSDRKEGLKRLGKKNENTELGIYFIIEQKGDELIFKDNTESSFIMSANKEQYRIKIPNSIRLDWSTNCTTEKKERNYFFFNSEKSSLSNFNGEASISTSIHSINLKDVTGPVSINTIGGNVIVVFDEKTPKNLYSIYSNNGFIDITLPTNSNINVNATATDIFSDINFKLEEEKVVEGLQEMKLKLNSGKVKMNLDAGLGNIYLRKK